MKRKWRVIYRGGEGTHRLTRGEALNLLAIFAWNPEKPKQIGDAVYIEKVVGWFKGHRVYAKVQLPT